MGSNANRRHERLFGTVGEESKYTADILANGRTAADRERKYIQENTADNIGGVLIGTWTYDFKNQTEKFVRVGEETK